jgi:hypothetical protein
MDAPLNLKPIVGQVYLAQFPTQEELANTMLRFQEFYESPKFHGTFFSREEFEKWYAEKNGAFTYLTDWDGFNIPSTVFEPFLRGKFDPLSEQEWQLIEATAHLERPFYLIATSEDPDPTTLRHEIAHGLYATNPDYRAEVYMLMEGCQLAPIHRMLRPGYHPAVWLDECHAYLLANYHDVLKDEGVLKDDSLLEVHQALASAFDYYTHNRFKE